MAWVDDRIWCHPKFADLSAPAFRLYVHGLAYSTGFATGGILTPGQQRTIGAETKTRRELVAARLWDEVPDGVEIHDWKEHNSKRDARRKADRERKRSIRESARLSMNGSADSPVERPQDSPQDAPQSRRALTEVTVVKELSKTLNPSPRALAQSQPYQHSGGTNAHASGEKPPRLERLLQATGTAGQVDVEVRFIRALKNCSEADVVAAIEACKGPKVNDPIAVALSTLRKRKERVT